MKKKVIIDSDPGIDDLLALAVAFASDNLDIMGISTVFGNVSLDDTTANMELIVKLFNQDLRIMQGSSKPLVRDKKPSSVVHGADGLANLRVKYNKLVDNDVIFDKGLIHLYETIKAQDKVNIIALGPLTNIAKLLLFDESIKEHIDEVHIMGGGNRIGNVNELAEFNFYSDSEAASIVLNSGLDIYLSSLDVTKKVYFTSKELASIEAVSPQLKLIKDSLEFYVGFDPYLHDVCSVLSLSRPEFFESRKVSLDIINCESDADGMLFIKDNIKGSSVHYLDTNQRPEIVGYLFELLKKAY